MSLFSPHKSPFSPRLVPTKVYFYIHYNGHIYVIKWYYVAQSMIVKTLVIARFLSIYKGFLFFAPSEIRTPDTLIKSQVLYLLS